MGKLIKWLIGLIGAVALLVVIAVIVLPMVIDPNDYKGDIAKAVREQTGRELTISEPLKLSVFPWLGIDAGGVSLSNAPGFGEAPFASLGALELRVKLLPLFSGKLQVDTVVVQDLTLNLARDARGATNWEGLSGKDKGKVDAKQEKAGERRDLALDVQGVEVRNARLVWDDRQAKSRYELKDLNLTTGAFAAGSTSPVTLAFALDGGEQGVKVSVDLEGTLTVREDLLGYAVPDLALQIKAAGAGLPEPLKVDARAALAADMAAERVALSKLVAKFDESTLSGNIDIDSFAGPAMQVRLKLDQIDLDRYLPAPAEGKSGDTKPVAAQQPGKPAGDDPLAGLRGLVLDGQIDVGKLKVKNLNVSDIKVTVKAKDGVLRADPLQALLYDGKLSGRVELDARNKTPRISVRNMLAGVQAGPLLKDLTGKDKVTGKGDVEADLRMSGLDDAAIRRSLNGTARIAFADGAIKGVNIAQLIRQAQAKLAGTTVPDGPQQTDFSELTGSARIVNGVLDNQDLSAKSPLLRVAGKGQVDLPAERIDYRLTAELVKSLEGQGGAGIKDVAGLPIPVRITGALADPKFAVDLESVVHSKVKEQAKQKIEQVIQDKAGDKVKGLLKGFGL